MSGGFRVSIPNNVRKTIQNIKEIAGNHGDEEIYAMLKECSMDPNETAQKLLLQDTFHEVKRKRDRRKENNREPLDSRWRPGVQGRGGRGGRGNYSSRFISHDVGGLRSVSAGKENGVKQGTYKGITSSSSPITQDIEYKSSISTSSPVVGLANGPTPIAAQECTSQVSGVSGVTSVEESSDAEINEMGAAVPPVDVKTGSAAVIGDACGQHAPSSEQFLSSITSACASGVYASSSDPVLVSFVDSRIPVGAIKREVRSQRTGVETAINKVASPDVAASELSSISGKGSSEISISYISGNMPDKSQGFDVNQLSDTSQHVSSFSHTSSMGSRPSSNYSSRSHQLSGPQKAGPSKEWKPKPTNVNPVQSSGTLGTSVIEPGTAETIGQSLAASASTASEVTISKLQKKLEELQFSNTQHVIIPEHLQVAESERTGLSFGSFNASFGVSTSFANGLDSDKSSTPLSESSQEIEENAEEPSSSIENASPAAQEADYPDHLHSPTQRPENLSPREANISSNIYEMPEYDQPKSEAALVPEGPQYSVVHTAPTYSTFGSVPQMLGGQFAPSESTEPQSRDVSRLPSFIVQQPFDPSASYYTQIYRPTADADGRFSPFLAPVVAPKYNGNIAVLPAQTGQAPQESGNSLTGATPHATQAAGVMQSSITQQPVPVFRPPAGLQLSHYSSNYMPYSQYFPPFYVPPPTIHHFLSNTTFPQQPPTGSVYPPPPAATHLKYSLSQYKPGTNSGNTTHVGMPTSYGMYSSNPVGYNPSPSVTSGNSTGNEDLTASQYKENNVYMTGQQSEGSPVWFSASGRDISGLQASSFYNVPPQGQQMTFTPTQAGPGAFTGLYHPTQTVAAGSIHPLLQQAQTMAGAVEIMGSPAGVYQQPQRSQWANNY